MKLRYQICDTERCTDENLKKLFFEEENQYLCRFGSFLFISHMGWSREVGPYFDDVARKAVIPFEDLDECWLIELDDTP